MIIKKIKKMFAGLLLVSMTHLHAEPVLCPEVNIIQDAASKINVATKPNDTYTVYTENYVYISKKMYWRVQVRGLAASSDEDALQKGRKSVKYTTLKEQEEATQIDSIEYICAYGPEHVYALGVYFER